MKTGQEIAESFEIAAKNAGISVSELCRRASIDRSTFARWKDGTYFPSYRAILAVEDVLNGNNQ